MRVGLISQWYEPEPGAAAHPAAIARALHRRGHEVRVLTGFPNYPHGKIYPEYTMRPRSRENRDGVQVVRVPLHASHDDSGLRRAVSLASFALSATSQVLTLRDVDVCLVYLTPATVGLAARVLRRLAGVPYVLYVQDLWPESVLASGFIRNHAAEALVARGIDVFCSGLYRRAGHVAAIAPAMARMLTERGACEEKVSVVYNWVDEAVFRPVPRDPFLLEEGPFWLMYAGGIGDIQGLEAAVDALALLGPDVDVRLALVGDGVAVPRLQQRALDAGVSDRIRFLGRRPMHQMPAIMASADAQLISLRDLPLFHATVPSKTQSTMACGLPIVCAVPGDSARLVRESGAGVAVPPENPQALSDAMREMALSSSEDRRRLGRSARAYYEAHLSEAVGAARLEGLLRASAEGRNR